MEAFRCQRTVPRFSERAGRNESERRTNLRSVPRPRKAQCGGRPDRGTGKAAIVEVPSARSEEDGSTSDRTPRLRRWLCRKHKQPSPGEQRFPDSYLHDTLGLVRLPQRTRDLPWAKAGRPHDLNPCPRAGTDRRLVAGNPHVRFDEREVETEPRPPRHLSTLPKAALKPEVEANRRMNWREDIAAGIFAECRACPAAERFTATSNGP